MVDIVNTDALVAGWLCAHHLLLAFFVVVAVYVKGSWWATEDVLRTSDPAREGLMKVRQCNFKWTSLQNRFTNWHPYYHVNNLKQSSPVEWFSRTALPKSGRRGA